MIWSFVFLYFSQMIMDALTWKHWGYPQDPTTSMHRQQPQVSLQSLVYSFGHISLGKNT